MSQATSHQSDPRVLLRRGADGGNEAAFETLAGEFKGLVYSTALCRYDAPQMAEDVAQTVLAIVARKAKALQMVVHFAAWLHTTATGVTSHAMRTGSRHRRKIKALTAQSASISPVGGSSKDWCSMHPHRNEALERLPERDRRVVMLHYDEGLNFREIVGRLGKSEAAAQRQGQRSIEKLAGTLRREGVVCATVPVPGADLGVQFAAPAPAALATEALAISSLATASFRRRDHSDLRHEASHGQTKTILIAAVALSVALVPLGIQRPAISKPQRRLVELKESQLAAGSRSGEVSADAGARSGSKPRLLTAPKTRGEKSTIERPKDLLGDFEGFAEAEDIEKRRVWQPSWSRSKPSQHANFLVYSRMFR